ncbi:MAG: EamA family transporter [Chloroflexota bacterium]
MLITSLLPLLFGLGAALTWGLADFAGGLGSRQAGVYRLVWMGEWVGLVCLLPCPLLFREPLPPANDLLLAVVASLSGILGVLMLYQALAKGQMSITAPVSALLSASVPVLVSAWTEGFPGGLKIAAFGLALAAIWLVSSAESEAKLPALQFSKLGLPLLSGLAFGVYFVLMHHASQQATFWPLISARLVSSLLLTAYLWGTRQLVPLPRPAQKLAALNGALDATANLLYLLAGQFGRLDIAAVLSSLYPGVTVLMAGLLLKERLARPQIAGVILALAAILLIAA